jgi:hypothetical protein
MFSKPLLHGRICDEKLGVNFTLYKSAEDVQSWSRRYGAVCYGLYPIDEFHWSSEFQEINRLLNDMDIVRIVL